MVWGLFALALAIVLGFVFWLTHSTTNDDGPPAKVQNGGGGRSAPTVSFRSDEQRAEAEFDRWLAEAVKDTATEWFHSRVAGVSHKNEDGSKRQILVRRCRPKDCLSLLLDPENAYSRHAVKVLTQKGRQLGFLPDETAKQIFERTVEGERFTAIVRSLGPAGEGENWGLTIVVLCLSDDFVIRNDLD